MSLAFPTCCAADWWLGLRERAAPLLPAKQSCLYKSVRPRWIVLFVNVNCRSSPHVAISNWRAKFQVLTPGLLNKCCAGRDAVSLDEWLPTFRRIVVSSSLELISPRRHHSHSKRSPLDGVTSRKTCIFSCWNIFVSCSNNSEWQTFRVSWLRSKP